MLENVNLKKQEVADISDTRVWSNPNFRYIFDRLFKFSIDLPIDLWDEFAEYDLCDAALFKSARNKLIMDGEFFDYNQWTHKASYEELFEPLFLDVVFAKGVNKIGKADFVEKLSYPKYRWMMSSVELRKKYIRFNNRYDAEKQNKKYFGE